MLPFTGLAQDVSLYMISVASLEMQEGREGFDGDTVGAGGDEAGVGRDVDRWVGGARLGTFFVEEEDECSCERADGETVEEDVEEEKEEEFGGYGRGDEKRDKRFGRDG